MDSVDKPNQWKIIKFGKEFLRVVTNGVIAPVLILIVLIAGGIIGYVITVFFGIAPDISVSVGIWVFLSIVSFILTFLSHLNVLRLREVLPQPDFLFGGIRSRRIISLHIFLYGVVFSGVLVLVLFLGVESSEVLTSHAQSDSNLSSNQIRVATTSLQTLGLLIPIWIGLVNLGIKAYFENSPQNKKSDAVSAHEFIAVGSVGYLLLVVSLSFIIWSLLPVMPSHVVNGMLVLLFALAFVGIHFITLDKKLEREKEKEKTPVYIQ